MLLTYFPFLGVIPGTVYYKNHSNLEEVYVTVTPFSGKILQPKEEEKFCIRIFVSQIGKFLTKLRFKINSGRHIFTVIRYVTFYTLVAVKTE